MWNAVAEYADGTRIEKNFPYYEDGNYQAECERQYELEAWLIEQHERLSLIHISEPTRPY